MKRCFWQVHVWYNAHIPIFEALNPTNFGWKFENEELLPIYFEGPTSLELLQKYICNCRSKKTSCDNEFCSCYAAGIKCCLICNCTSNCSLQPMLIQIKNIKSNPMYYVFFNLSTINLVLLIFTLQ